MYLLYDTPIFFSWLTAWFLGLVRSQGQGLAVRRWLWLVVGVIHIYLLRGHCVR